MTQRSVHRVLPLKTDCAGGVGGREEAAGQVQEGGRGGQGHMGLCRDKWADPGFIL